MREPRAAWHGQPPLAPLTRSLQVGAADSAGTAVAALSSQSQLDGLYYTWYTWPNEVRLPKEITS